jgi:hypothetical protein
VPGEVGPLLSALLGAGYHAGLPLSAWYPDLADCISVAVTEKRTREEIDGLVAVCRQLESRRDGSRTDKHQRGVLGTAAR